MKTLLLLLALCGACLADTAIYKASGAQTVYGFGKTQRVAVRGFLLINTVSGVITNISASVISGNKTFSVRQLQNFRMDHVDGPRGGKFTIITMASAPSSQYAGVLSESLYLRGAEAPISISANGTVSIPRVFALKANATVEANGAIGNGDSVGVMTLDVRGSRTSNLFETYDQAVARFTSYYIGLGYTQITLLPAN